MKTDLYILTVLLFCNQYIISQNVIVSGRVGIGSSTPKGQLEISSTNLGLVVPRVANVNTVTNGTAGQLAIDGTIVYDSLREAFMFRIDSQWLSLSIDNEGRPVFGDLTNYTGNYTYGKASNTGVDDWFGYSAAINYDGTVIVVGGHHEDSNATGINGNQADNSALDAGAVYVFVRTGSVWSQQAYIKASNTEAGDEFGRVVSVSADGNTIAVGARWEDSNAEGINGNQLDNSDTESGAVYIFVRTAGVWSQQAYIKATNGSANDEFGHHLDVSADGNTVAVGAPYDND